MAIDISEFLKNSEKDATKDNQPQPSCSNGKSTQAPESEEVLRAGVVVAIKDAVYLPPAQRLEFYGIVKQIITTKLMSICLEDKEATPKVICKLLRDVEYIEKLEVISKRELNSLDEQVKSEEGNKEKVADEDIKAKGRHQKKRRVSFSDNNQCLEFRSEERVSDMLYPPFHIHIIHSEQDAKAETLTKDINENFVAETPGDYYRMYMKSLQSCTTDVKSNEPQDEKMFFEYGYEGQENVKVSLCRLGIQSVSSEDRQAQNSETDDKHLTPESFTCPISIPREKNDDYIALPARPEVLFMSGGFSKEDLYAIPSSREDEGLSDTIETFHELNDSSLENANVATGSKMEEQEKDNEEACGEMRVTAVPSESGAYSEALDPLLRADLNENEASDKVCTPPEVINMADAPRPDCICLEPLCCSDKETDDGMKHLDGPNQPLDECKGTGINPEKDKEILPTEEDSIDEKKHLGREHLKDLEPKQQEKNGVKINKAYVRYPAPEILVMEGIVKPGSFFVVPVTYPEDENKPYDGPNEFLPDYLGSDEEQDACPSAEPELETICLEPQMCSCEIADKNLSADMKTLAGQVELSLRNPKSKPSEEKGSKCGGGDGQSQSADGKKSNPLTDSEKETLIWYFMQVIEVFEKSKSDEANDAAKKN